MNIELYIYDTRDTLISNTPELINWNIEPILDNSETEDVTYQLKDLLNYNIHNHMRKLNIVSGMYKFCILTTVFFIGDLFDNNIIKIDTISNNRDEIIIRFKSKDNFWTTLQKLQTTDDKQLIINLGKNRIYKIINWGLMENTTLPDPDIIDDSKIETNYTIALKLNDNLPEEVEPNTAIKIDEMPYEKYWQNISFIQKNKEYDVNILSLPNFEIKINKSSREDIPYHSWNQLLSSDTDIKNLLETNYFNFYEQTAQLNVDYTEFENFVFYSSAEHRVMNFRYKLQQIETFETNIDNVSVETYKDQYRSDIQEIRQNFDGYEYYLYYGSGSCSWPKDDSGDLLAINNSKSIIWYEGMIDSGSLYDLQNDSILRKTIPSAIANDEYSSQFYIFIDMIGQHFDILWLYAKHIGYLHDKSESLTAGLSKDLIYYMLTSYGWTPRQDNQFDDLWKYKLGEIEYNEELTRIDATTKTISLEQIDKEIWKRILNNLPYLLKTKGTTEGIRALINCYGIPRTELPIREYGGPNKLNVKSLNILDKFAYAIKLSTNTNIIVPYYNPGSIEFRFKLSNDSNQTLFERSDTNVALNTININSNYGRLQYVVGSYIFTSDSIPIYNNEWWSFMLTYDSGSGGVSGSHSYNVVTKTAKYNKINYEYSGSFIISGSNAAMFSNTDYSYYISYDGYMQEFRYWNTPLSQSAFDNHVLSPTSYNGNTATATWNDLIYRLPLGTDTNRYNHYTTTKLISQHPKAGVLGLGIDCIIDGGNANSGSHEVIDGGGATPFTSGTIDGGDADDIFCDDLPQVNFSGFSNEYNYVPVIEQYAHEWPDSGGNRNISNKIRIEENELIGQLNPYNSAEYSSYDLAPIDNGKLGVYFGPNVEVNQDIAEYMAGINLDNYIGTVDDLYKDYYGKLRHLKEFYLQQYVSKYDIYDYFRVISYFNNSLFRYIDGITPARAVKIVGLVVEPHILNRSKVKTIKSVPNFEKLELDTSYDLKPDTSLSEDDSYIYYEADVIINIDDNTYGEYNLYETEIDNSNWTSAQYEYTNTYFDNSGSAQQITTVIDGYIESINSYVKSQWLKVENPLYGYVSGAAQYVAAEVQDFKTIGFERMYWDGVKMQSPGWNQPSNDMFDKSPVVEFWESDIGGVLTK